MGTVHCITHHSELLAAYHPQANGMVERLHLQLKATLRDRLRSMNRMDELPITLLGIRSAWGEVWYIGTYLHVLYILYIFKENILQLVDNYITQLLHFKNLYRRIPTEPANMYAQNALPPPMKYAAYFSQVLKNLPDSGYVYSRRISSVLTGPYRIIGTSDKCFTVDIDGNSTNVGSVG